MDCYFVAFSFCSSQRIKIKIYRVKKNHKIQNTQYTIIDKKQHNIYTTDDQIEMNYNIKLETSLIVFVFVYWMTKKPEKFQTSN